MAKKGSSQALIHRLWRSHPLPEGEGYLLDDGFCDFAFGSAQNDRVGGILRRVNFFRLENPTERKSVAMSIDFGLMLCALVLG